MIGELGSPLYCLLIITCYFRGQSFLKNGPNRFISYVIGLNRFISYTSIIGLKKFAKIFPFMFQEEKSFHHNWSLIYSHWLFPPRLHVLSHSDCMFFPTSIACSFPCVARSRDQNGNCSGVSSPSFEATMAFLARYESIFSLTCTSRFQPKTQLIGKQVWKSGFAKSFRELLLKIFDQDNCDLWHEIWTGIVQRGVRVVNGFRRCFIRAACSRK